MRASFIVLFCVLAAGAARAQSLPDCRALVPALQQDPSSVNDGEPLLGVDYIVEAIDSTQDSRICTGVARYHSSSPHLTYVAQWRDAATRTIDVNAHATTDDEAAARAQALRLRLHPKGEDGTYSVKAFLPHCADPAFQRRAQQELRLGIADGVAFFREPNFTVYGMQPNGDTSGFMADCVATVGDGKSRGDLFMGTQWVERENAERFEYYVLAAGPEDFQIENRLWTMGTE